MNTRGPQRPRSKGRPVRKELRQVHLEEGVIHEHIHRILTNTETIMATQAEQAEILRKVQAQQQKTLGEIETVQANVTTLNEKVAALQAVIDGGTGTTGEATQELIDAVEAVRAQAQIVDESIPDLPEPTPTP